MIKSLGLCGLVSTVVLLGCAHQKQDAVASVATDAPVMRLEAPSTPVASSVPFSLSPRQVVLSAEEVSFPLVNIGGTPVIEWTDLAGNQRRFLIDTGANAVVISTGVAAAQRLPIRDAGATANDASLKKMQIPAARVGALTLGEARFEDFDAAAIAPHSAWDGFLGWSLFKDVLLTIDYDHDAMILKHGELPQPDGIEVLPLREVKNQLMVPLHLDGHEIWVLLDTGWGNAGGLELTAGQTDGLRWASVPAPSTMTITPLGSSKEKLGRLAGELKIGRHRIPQPVAGVGGGNSVPILGAQLLQYFSVTLDIHNMRVRFQRESHEPIAMPPVLLPCFSVDLTKNPVPVTEVLRGSEAERSGLRVGDLLIEVDGQPAVDGMYGHQDDQPFSLKFSRDGRMMTLEVPFTKVVP